MNHPPNAALKPHLRSQLMLSIPAHSEVLWQILCVPVGDSDAESPRIQPAVGEAGAGLEKVQLPRCSHVERAF